MFGQTSASQASIYDADKHRLFASAELGVRRSLPRSVAPRADLALDFLIDSKLFERAISASYTAFGPVVASAVAELVRLKTFFSAPVTVDDDGLDTAIEDVGRVERATKEILDAIDRANELFPSKRSREACERLGDGSLETGLAMVVDVDYATAAGCLFDMLVESMRRVHATRQSRLEDVAKIANMRDWFVNVWYVEHAPDHSVARLRDHMVKEGMRWARTSEAFDGFL